MNAQKLKGEEKMVQMNALHCLKLSQTRQVYYGPRLVKFIAAIRK